MKESAYTSESGEIRYKDTKYIRRQSRSLSEERLAFRNGERLGDVSISIESGKTLRKVRRIVEKRVCHDYWNQRDSGRNTARNRYAMKHRVSNHLRNIYGFVPTGLQYAACSGFTFSLSLKIFPWPCQTPRPLYPGPRPRAGFSLCPR